LKNAIVTGGAGGIGRAIAETLVDAGYRVGVFDLEEGPTELVAEGLREAVALVADVRDGASVEAAFEAFGTIPDLVVNNAGVVTFGPLIEQTVEDFKAVVDVNLLGCFIVSRCAAREMAEGDGGHIVNVTSINSRTPGPGCGAYPATKSAIVQLTRQMAIECGPAGVRVNAVSPGFIDAGMSAPIYSDPTVRKHRAEAVPLRRLGNAKDVADAVLFLDSAAAAYINGHELVVDGGVVHSMLDQLPRD
jgi:NAD(P)-dependent dehydrogenase (short-subunit alcohol dehydrogenase family)